MEQPPILDDQPPQARQPQPSNGPYRITDVETALSAIDHILQQDGVSDFMINGHDNIYIEQGGLMLHAPFVLADSELVSELAEHLAVAAGKSDMLSRSFVVDGVLPNGNRITLIMPPAVLDSTSISIRRFQESVSTMSHMVEQGLMTPRIHAFLAKAIERRANILISGNTSSGKTTLLNALTEVIPAKDRIVTIEDTPELKIQQENVIRMEVDAIADPSDPTAATAERLLRSSLRIRPDRIIMGEIRGVEAFEFIQAINTGHNGSMATIHANTPRETLTRLEHMVNIGFDLPSKVIRQQIASSLDLVIQTHRNFMGTRRISHITEVVGMEGDIMTTHDHFVYGRNADGEMGYQWDRTNSRNNAIQEAIRAASKV